MAKKILFISHDASRTGAPIFLLRFLRWFKDNSDVEFQVLIGGSKGRESELLPEFNKIAPVILKDKYDLIDGGIMINVLDRFVNIRTFIRTLYGFYFKWKLLQSDTGLIYSNTIANNELLNSLAFLDCPVICHVHELDYTFDCFKILQLSNRITQFIAVSEAVKNCLIKKYNIPIEKIEKIYEFIPISDMKFTISRKKICEELCIPEQSLIVCSAGFCQWRKAPDLFIQVASIIKNNFSKPIHFIWLGDFEHVKLEIMYDINKLGVEQCVHFIGVKNNPIDYFAACDVFVLTSREDPFPLVCLEAAALGKPIICFDKSGGMPEFVQKDAGYVIPYLDTLAMAKSIMALFSDTELLNQFGQKARQRVWDMCDFDKGGRKIVEVIKKSITRKNK